MAEAGVEAKRPAQEPAEAEPEAKKAKIEDASTVPAAVSAATPATAAADDFDDSFADGPPKAGAEKTTGKATTSEAATASEQPAKAEKEADPFTIFVGGISYKCPEEQVELDFSEHGTIKNFRFLTDYDGNSRGIAFITYDSVEAVQNALKLDGDDYWGRNLKVHMAFDKQGKEAKGGRQGPNNLRVWVNSLPLDLDEASLRKDFAECGEIEDVTMPTDQQGKFRGFAFIAFKDKEAVEKALKFDGSKFGENFVVKMQANKDTKKDDDDDDDIQCLEVFVKGLSEKTAEEALKKHFEGCGEITSVKLPKNDDGKVKGYSFIAFAETSAAEKAVELNGKEFGDSGTIVVKLAKPKGKEHDEAGLEVFVKGLSEKTTEEALKKHFEGCGNITNVKLPKNDDDEVKGFAFIAFADSDSANKATKLDGQEFGDSGEIEVRIAKGKGKGKGKDKGKDKGKGKGKGKGKKGKRK